MKKSLSKFSVERIRSELATSAPKPSYVNAVLGRIARHALCDDFQTSDSGKAILEVAFGFDADPIAAGELLGVCPSLVHLRGAHGMTPVHHAARHGNLGHIPQNLLTEDVMTTGDAEGDTPIHHAVQYGFLDQIPANCRTKRILSARNHEGKDTGYWNAVGLADPFDD